MGICSILDLCRLGERLSKSPVKFEVAIVLQQKHWKACWGPAGAQKLGDRWPEPPLSPRRAEPAPQPTSLKEGFGLPKLLKPHSAQPSANGAGPQQSVAA